MCMNCYELLVEQIGQVFPVCLLVSSATSLAVFKARWAPSATARWPHSVALLQSNTRNESLPLQQKVQITIVFHMFKWFQQVLVLQNHKNNYNTTNKRFFSTTWLSFVSNCWSSLVLWILEHELTVGNASVTYGCHISKYLYNGNMWKTRKFQQDCPGTASGTLGPGQNFVQSVAPHDFDFFQPLENHWTSVPF